MKSLSLGTVLEKNFCSNLSNYLNVFFEEKRYFKGGIDSLKILNKYIFNKNKVLPIYRSSLIDRIYKMKANYFFDVINVEEYEGENDVNPSSYNTSFGSFSSSYSSSFVSYNSYSGSFLSTSFSYDSFSSYALRSSYQGSYASSYGNIGSFRHYGSYIGSYMMYGSYRGSYGSFGSYGSYGSYNFYKVYSNSEHYKTFDNENIDDSENNNTMVFKRNIGYPKSIGIKKNEYKNKDMIILSQIEDKDFVTGYGLELI
ncbi:hypothetical protein HMPREF0379_0932 [[Eubacterium] yurii subsp. margaretiae ATCC 43715]|nr:hypothetical protein HMPREF0379_0932 [[Eubacterium] yurii subsp. margaretiae ATCC 43715]